MSHRPESYDTLQYTTRNLIYICHRHEPAHRNTSQTFVVSKTSFPALYMHRRASANARHVHNANEVSMWVGDNSIRQWRCAVWYGVDESVFSSVASSITHSWHDIEWKCETSLCREALTLAAFECWMLMLDCVRWSARMLVGLSLCAYRLLDNTHIFD